MTRCHAQSGVALLVWLLASPAFASPDTFLLGNGQDGPLTVATPAMIVNTYTAVTSSIAIGTTAIDVASTTGFASGDLVLVWQAAGSAALSEADPLVRIDLYGSQTGRFELARVQSLTPTRLNVATAMVRSYALGATQVVRVPEHTTVSVSATGSITAAAWNPANATGGIVVLFANGTVTLDGAIDVTGAGHRGGAVVHDASATLGCTGANESAALGARSGEGVVTSEFVASMTGGGN